jgi:hypothetical protein
MVGEQVYSLLTTNQRHGCLEFSLYKSPIANFSLSTEFVILSITFIGASPDSSAG